MTKLEEGDNGQLREAVEIELRELGEPSEPVDLRDFAALVAHRVSLVRAAHVTLAHSFVQRVAEILRDLDADQQRVARGDEQP